MDLKETLIKEGIIKIKTKDELPYILKSGIESRLFIDIKQASLNPIILRKIIAYLDKLISESDFDYDLIGSVAIGAVPITSVFSYINGTSQIIVRSEKHDRGTQSQVIGDCKSKRVLLIEDVATSGGSIVSAVKAIRDVGGICDECIVIVDRQEGAQLNCSNNEITLYSLLQKEDFGIKENI